MMKPGDRICVMGHRKLPSGFMIYATNVIPMNVSIPEHFTTEEAKELLMATAAVYEKSRARMAAEYADKESVQAKVREEMEASVPKREPPTVEQQIDAILKE